MPHLDPPSAFHEGLSEAIAWMDGMAGYLRKIEGALQEQEPTSVIRELSRDADTEMTFACNKFYLVIYALEDLLEEANATA